MKEAKSSVFPMTFILGVVLLVLGFILPTIPQEVTRYRYVMGFQVPYRTTEYPYQALGVLLILLATSFIAYSIYIKKTTKN